MVGWGRFCIPMRMHICACKRANTRHSTNQGLEKARLSLLKKWRLFWAEKTAGFTHNTGHTVVCHHSLLGVTDSFEPISLLLFNRIN